MHHNILISYRALHHTEISRKAWCRWADKQFYILKNMTDMCEVTLGVIPASVRWFAYDARFLCHSFVRLC